MRIVLDTAAIVAAVRSDAGASRRLLLAAFDREVTIVASVPLLIEYEAVLTRSDHLKASGLSREEMETLLDAIATIAEPIKLAFVWRPAARDPDDDMVLEAAVNGQADAIVTFNQRDLFEGAAGFGVEVLSPGMAWRRLEARR